MKQLKELILLFMLSAAMATGCVPDQPAEAPEEVIQTSEAEHETAEETVPESPAIKDEASEFDAAKLQEYDGSAWITVNNDVPFFTEEDMTTECYISLSELDELGRCGPGMMCAGLEFMPDGERGEIGMIKPSGWVQEKYPDVIEESPSYLYNRAHILMWALSGINADERGLITGTRYMNIEGMLPNEEMVLDYIESTGEHVMCRVTPVFTGDNLLADGVLMEARSVESDGLMYCRYAYNVQPGIVIDYATGESYAEGYAEPIPDPVPGNGVAAYIGNKNSMIFHLPDCGSVDKMKEKNKVYFYGDREEPISQGYEPCGGCNP